MSLPVTGNLSLILAVLFGGVFGALLHRGRVADYNVIVNQFRFRDFTVLRVMFTAIVVGGIGIFVLHGIGLAQYHIKSADMLAVILGALLFGIGMVIYGYCPGTGVAAVGTGSIHALIGFLGMLVGGIFYALSFSWIKENVLTVWSLGKIRLPDLSGVHDLFWLSALLIIAVVLFRFIDKPPASPQP
jgi:uncharacterized protein